MQQAFIIMQIGNTELDKVCEAAIVPAIKACGFDPKRVDKHNEGRLLKSEIVQFIESSDIIVADLTNERPNCYLEIGYAMGLDKFRNLILTAREDHHHESPNYKKGGPKIHFDLSGYDILFWNPDKIDEFRNELEKRIRRRLLRVRPSEPKPVSKWDEEWLNSNQEIAKNGLKKTGKNGYMEIRTTLLDYVINVAQNDLLHAADVAQIHTIGWPIGIVGRDAYRPLPKTDGIQLDVEGIDWHGHKRYDYWTLRRDGSFFLLKTLFEDDRKPGYLFFNTRIVRITETFMHAVRLYSALKVPMDTQIAIGVKHGGLKDRMLIATGSRVPLHPRKSSEDETYTEVEATLEEIESNLTDLVKMIVQPLFIVFEYFEVNDKVLRSIVDNYVAGKVT